MQKIDLFFLFGLFYIVQSIIGSIWDAVKKNRNDIDYDMGSYTKMNPNQGISFIKKNVNAGCLITLLYFVWVIAGYWTDLKPFFIVLTVMPVLTLIIMQGKKPETKQGKVIMAIDFLINKLVILIILYKHFGPMLWNQ